MELVRFDETTKEYTIKMPEQDYLDSVNFVQQVYATADKQDLTALGVYTKQRVMEVLTALTTKQNLPNQGEYTLRLSKLDFLDLFDMMQIEALYDFPETYLTEERVRELTKELHNLLRKDLNKPPV